MRFGMVFGGMMVHKKMCINGEENRLEEIKRCLPDTDRKHGYWRA